MSLSCFHKITALFFGVLLASCGNTHGPGAGGPISAGQTCTPSTAVIQVGDTFLRRACGCTEAANTIFNVGSALTCTVAAGTSVIFTYEGAVNSHQILSNGTPAFTSSQPYLPSQGQTNPTHAVTLSTRGNYAFSDAFIPALNGTLIVQ